MDVCPGSTFSNESKPTEAGFFAPFRASLPAATIGAHLPDGRYFVEWYEAGKRRRVKAGVTVAQAQEAQRRKHHELEGRKLGITGI